MNNDELSELRSLVEAMKTDRLAQKEKEKREVWTKYVSLSMIVLAVLAAVATQKGGGYSSTVLKQLNEATFNQAQASDQWAFYQAKGIKASLAENEREQYSALGNPDAKQIAALNAKIDRYDKERKEISVAAKDFEKKREEARDASDKAAAKGRELGLSTSMFQIAIALGGVTLVMKKRWLWFVSLLAGVLATVQMFKVLGGF